MNTVEMEMSPSNSTKPLPIDKVSIETPALLVDLDALEFNLEHMAQFFRGVSAKLRPHFKTYKTPSLAHKQIEVGAVGITCAKLS